MAQVLIERPRYGSRSGNYRKQRRNNQRENWENSQKREGIRHRYARPDKSFNDLFGPVIRFLRRNVGRPWDKVFQEICEFADERNVAQRHLRTHIGDFVTLKVEICDGKVYSHDGYYTKTPLEDRYWPAFYVCPNTGLLRLAKKKKRCPHSLGNRITVSADLQYHRKDGEWFRVTLRPLPEHASDIAGCFDAWLGQPVSRLTEQTLQKTYGQIAYALSCKKLTSTESRQVVKNAKRRLSRKHTD